jgi:2-dehydro-3-deoxyphosphooctonate aldolase (KDO 8-P synthase)
MFYEQAVEGQLSFIAGPCVFESRQHMDDMVGWIEEVMVMHNVNWIYKTSFDKANRSSNQGYRGKGIDEAIYAFTDHAQMGLEIITDVHEAWQCGVLPVSMLQIPAFLCRQTDLLQAAAGSGKPVNVKKGQFLSPQEMKNVVDKLEDFDAAGIMLTERGSSFGYNNLVVDMRSLKVMKDYGYPVCFDATHSCQSPGGLGNASGGDRTMAPLLANAAMATGCINTVFIEVHQDPDNAPSDGPNMIKIDDLLGVVGRLKKLHFANDQYNLK